MKCQSFPCVAAVFACTLAWTLASSHAAGRVVQMDGMDVGNTMGVNTWAAFAGTADDALVVGEFAVLESHGNWKRVGGNCNAGSAGLDGQSVRNFEANMNFRRY